MELSLKEKLLKTEQFIDNIYLEQYVQIIENAQKINGYFEEHHIIPVSYYKNKYYCKTRSEAEKWANNDANNAIVKVCYLDHIRLHCLLYFCTKDKLKQASAATIFIMFKDLRKLPAAYEELLPYIKKIKNDSKNNYFSDFEDTFLVHNYYNLGIKKCAAKLDRPVGSICTRAKYIGLKSKITYTSKQKAFLIANYELHEAKYCADKLNRSTEAIQKYAEATLHIRGKKYTKTILCVELNKIFESATEAASFLNILSTSINNCLYNKSKTAGGYHWKYKEI